MTFQVNHQMSKEVKKLLHDFYFKMFQSFRFKQQLGLSFASNFEIVSLERSDSDNYYLGSIGVQILTIDDVGMMIMQDPQLREIMIQTYSKVLDSLVDSKFESKKDVTSIFHVLYDLKYITKPKTLNYLVYETDFLELLLG